MTDDEGSTSYERVTAPIVFRMCVACKGFYVQTTAGIVRAAPFGEACACEAPTAAERRVTYATTIVVPVGATPETDGST